MRIVCEVIKPSENNSSARFFSEEITGKSDKFVGGIGHLSRL